MRIGCNMIGAALLVACGSTDPTIDREANWTIDHATTDGVLLGVWGSGPDDVWIVGGTLALHFTGKKDGSK